MAVILRSDLQCNYNFLLALSSFKADLLTNKC